MNQRSMHGPRRVDTAWPQTQVMRRRRCYVCGATPDDVCKAVDGQVAECPRIVRSLIDWRNPLEASAAVCAGIGFAVLAAMWAGVVA